MNRRCRHIQHLLTLAIMDETECALPPVISCHLEQCAHCRCFHAEITRLHADLSRALPSPVFAADFTERVLQRTQHPSPQPSALIARSSPGKGSQSALSPHRLKIVVSLLPPNLFGSSSPQTWRVRGAALAAGVLAFLWMNSRTPVPHQQQNAIAVAPMLQTVPQPPKLEKKNKETPRILTVTHKTSKRMAARQIPRRVGVWRKRQVARTGTNKPFHSRFVAWNAPPKPLSPEVRSRQWTRWAAACEAKGDLQQAADGYAEAYRAFPNEDTAFSAGQAAENTGDISEAISYYSQILRQPLRQKPQPEKGTRLWNVERDAA